MYHSTYDNLRVLFLWDTQKLWLIKLRIFSLGKKLFNELKAPLEVANITVMERKVIICVLYKNNNPYRYYIFLQSILVIHVIY